MGRKQANEADGSAEVWFLAPYRRMYLYISMNSYTPPHFCNIFNFITCILMLRVIKPF
ncbi:hypothetical protein TELCIR_23917 [Teladorsagia circumcincta]|uniref:Uncharacterized protein n=1 Tax=Teladorsagia circumcincta TaxID=45464 RepID=A0A2G9T9R3_TELCI|nr:hypothetical protein TELCIR_23917 [Teladorsagia circumcincta]